MINRSQIFKAAHAAARQMTGGTYHERLSIALKVEWARAKNPPSPSIVDRLRAVGASEWQAYGKHRWYINGELMARLYGLEVSYYGTGNISSVRLGGEKISNTRAKKILARFIGAKLWFDMEDHKWHFTLDSEYAEEIIKAVETADVMEAA